ncbi:MAG: GIY-YIG nuclease family protein [Fusobacteriaceae bacterium]
MNEFIVYKYKNIETGLVYIGQTQDEKRRKSVHKSQAKCGYAPSNTWLNAIRHYGLESFEYSVIDTAETKEEILIKEEYWIDKYNSADINYGYNTSHGNRMAESSKKLMSIARTEYHAKKVILIKTIFENMKLGSPCYFEGNPIDYNVLHNINLTDFFEKNLDIKISKSKEYAKRQLISYGITPRTLKPLFCELLWNSRRNNFSIRFDEVAYDNYMLEQKAVDKISHI